MDDVRFYDVFNIISVTAGRPKDEVVTANNVRAGPRTLEYGGGGGGHRMSRHDVSGGSRKGGEYEKGSPPLI